MKTFKPISKIVEILTLGESPLKEEIVEFVSNYLKEETDQTEYPIINFYHNKIIVVQSMYKKISFEVVDKNIIMKETDIEEDTNTELTIITNDESMQLIENHYVNKQLEYINTSVLNKNGNLLVAQFRNGITTYSKKTDVNYKRPITEVLNIDTTNNELMTTTSNKVTEENNESQKPKENYIKTYQ